MRLRNLLFCLMVGLPPLLLHLDHLGPGRIPYLRDLSRTHLPVKGLAMSEMRAGRLPLWNPTHGSGAPLLANPNFFHFHPVTALFLVLPYPTAFSLGLAALSLFGSVGMALWLRALGRSRTAAACGALAFALGGLGVSLTNLYNLLASYMTVPWALWAAAGIGGADTHRRVGLLAVALAAVIAGGEPSAWGWALLIAAAMATVSTSGKPRRWRERVTALVPLAAAAALSLGLASVQLMPLLRLTPHTVRGVGFTYRGATYHSVDPARLVEIAWPHFIGDPTEPWRADYRGRTLTDGGVPFFFSLYAGIPVLALAAIGLARPGGSRGPLGLLALLSVLLALGHHLPFYEVIWRWLPPLGWFRYPEKFLLPFYLVTAVLAARGVDLSARRLGRLLSLLPILVAVDLLVAHYRLVPGTDARSYLEPPAVAAHLNGRTTYFWREHERWTPAVQDRAAFYREYQLTGVPPAFAPFAVRYVLDPDPDILDPVRMADLGRLVHRSPEDRARLLPMTAVERVIAPDPLGHAWLESLTTGPPHIYAMRSPIPYARVVSASQVTRVGSARAATDRLASPDFDPRREALFEGILPADAAPPIAATEPPAITVEWSRPRPDALELTATGPGLLVVSETWDRGWSATVDGAPATIAPANLAFIGIPLPAGSHTVRLALWPEGLTLGLGVTAISGLGALALAIAGRSGAVSRSSGSGRGEVPPRD